MNRRHLILAVALAAYPAVAQAAEPQATEPQAVQEGGGNDIVVTATRRSSTLQTTPVTVSALSGDDLAKLGIARVDQVAASVPNFYMQPGIANSSTVSLGMRGRGDNAGGFGTTEQPVSFYFDDVYQARPSAVNSELADIERIEVLRGPQGTLFGRNSMVGAVNVITKTPDNDSYGTIAVKGGNYSTFGAKASIGGPIVKDVLAASFSGVIKDQGKGYMNNLATGKSIDERDFWGVRGKLHFYGSDIWDVVLTGSYIHNKNDGFVTSPILLDPIRPLVGKRDTVTTAPQAGLTKSAALSAHVVGEFDGFTVKSITGWSNVNDIWSVDLVGGTIDKFGAYSLAYNRQSRIKQHQFTQELQVYGSGLDDKLSWILGAFYFTETTKQFFNDTFLLKETNLAIPNLYIPLTEKFYRNLANSYAGYAQLGYKLTDALEVTAGGRYTYETKDIRGYFAPGAAGAYGDKSSFKSFTPKVGVNYQAAPDHFLYASAGKGFRAGGYTSAADSRAVGETPYGPEKVTAYEIGSKNEFAGRKIKLNLAAFMNDFKDILVGRFIDGTAITVMFNGLSYRVVGLELESNFRPITGLDIYVNGGVQKASKFDYVPGAQISRPIDIPDYSGQAGFRYETPIGAGTKKVRFGADYVVRQGTWGTLDRQAGTKYSDIREINGEISLMDDDAGWKLSLVGHNLANRYEYQNNLNFAFIGSYARQPMLPRTWSLEASYKF
ncbi:TonB-dependent receptor [soil metagenome]